MANEQNLIPNNQRSPKEVRENGKKGGIRSGEVRREKAQMRDALKILLSLPVVDPKERKELKTLGFADDEMNNAVLPALGLYKQAKKGNPAAARLLAELNNENQVQGVTNIGSLDGNIEITFTNEKEGGANEV